MGVKWLISYRLTNDDNCEDRKGTFVVAYINVVVTEARLPRLLQKTADMEVRTFVRCHTIFHTHHSMN